MVVECFVENMLNGCKYFSDVALFFSLYLVFPARAPVMNSTEYLELVKLVPDAVSGIGRSAGHQAGFQMAALAITLAIAIIGGLITGRFTSSLHASGRYSHYL